jgi:regulator of protease activity HflC (stomatin/prohibitin superfamily)
MAGAIAGAAVAAVVLLVLARAVRVVQQGTVGVVKRLGQFRSIREPGITFLMPLIDQLTRVDIRESPRTGDRQEVITRDNVAVAVNATIFSQVVDAKAALFQVSDYRVAIEQQARTTLRNAFGNVSLDEALSERERLNADMQHQMETVTDKWGIRINRIEIVDITPPAAILQAMALQKQADQEKRAQILQSEGRQQSAVNIADGERQAAVKAAQGQREAAILRAEGARQAAILEAEGRSRAIATIYSAIKESQPDPTLVAILQIDALEKLAASDSSKLVVPVETAGLLGAAQALRTVISEFPVTSPDGKVVQAPPST